MSFVNVPAVIARANADGEFQLHARFWNDPVLAVCAWLPGPTDAVIAMYDHLLALTWESFCAMTVDLLPEAHRSGGFCPARLW